MEARGEAGHVKMEAPLINDNIEGNLKLEALKYAIDNDIIDLSYVQEKIEMNKRMAYLNRHCFKIWEGSDKKWRTYLPHETGRKMIKRKTKKDVEDAVIDFYKGAEEKERPKSFDDIYWHWRGVQDALVSPNTVVKYDTDYKRFFRGKDFSQKAVSEINEEDIKLFLVRTVKDVGLCKKSCKTLFGYIKNAFNSARINKVIAESPMVFLEAKSFYKYCTNNQKPKEKKLVSDEDMRKLYSKIKESYKETPQYIPIYAVHFASLTGMRVGEISALSWDCIVDSYIIINKSEKYDRMNKEYYIDATKNGKDRIFPITDNIRNLLVNVKSIEEEYGYSCEWVFANENGRIHAPMISSCLKSKCRQLGIDEKGIHAFRRTVNSKMRCNGVPSTVAASLLGHSEEVNEQHYTFDISTIKEKKEIVEGISNGII